MGDAGAGVGVASALCWTLLVWLSRRRQVFGSADEGYLWYGVQRTMAGEQPVLDFRSYEPGRYWLCAMAARSRGRGPVGPVRIRGTAHVAVGLALSAVGAAAGAANAPIAGLLVLPLLVLAWEGAQDKLFEVAALLLVAAAGIEALGGGQIGHFLLGGAVGLAAIIGANLGLYGGLAALAMLCVGLVQGSTGGIDVAACAAGGLCGLAPLLAWWFVRRGTWSATVRARLVVPWRRGSTNLPLPVPWPWCPSRPVGGAPTKRADVIARWTLLASPVLATAAVCWSLAHGHARTVVPMGFVGLIALHHVFSRADLNHLGRVAGMLFATAALVPGWAGVAASAVGAAVAVCLLWQIHPALLRHRRPDAYVNQRLGPDALVVPRRVAAQVNAVAAALRPDEGVASLPFGPLPVAAAGRRSAVRDTFAVYPAAPADDAAMRAELIGAGPVLVLVDQRPLDRNAALAFATTHPMTWDWLRTKAQPVTSPLPLPKTITLWRVASR